MILLNSNAQQIFWLGRYLKRIQYLCSQFPFENNEDALLYAHAFCLPAFDASSLNELVLDAEQPSSFGWQFQYAKDNVQDLRGLISAKAYAELNQNIKNACVNAAYICDVVDECHDVMEAESEEIFLFFKLGQCIEQLDRQLRLKQKIEQTVVELKQITALMKPVGWVALSETLLEFTRHQDLKGFYQLSDGLQHIFEVGTCDS
ncbi:hypothetical protein CDG60_11150 [Acinetobacter chinensis]|jgi:uncharacterized alpha-E superfamily protein|uniref:DUF403 domain-containing protein n=1 Tax=Acinetobacter chinensis TaxID=2004650 RepID=A0A3B7M369_9GAMM|nr:MULTISPECIES: alpha-E domain-containing protein [Acinetobacter]AXY57073.1 hypothetical protein CDG60_11150 [Acinetobacter chinensis]AXY60456.1 hypothetical protein CDG61_10725 [Acinetobacter sp. WCHAc010052]WOE40372.1 alpha-E domain-containing protein [Acinetobacter chinensis]